MADRTAVPELGPPRGVVWRFRRRLYPGDPELAVRMRGANRRSKLGYDGPRRPAAGRSTMCLPNFLVIGAPRSGTTLLHRIFTEHPGVFVPERKELHFFSHRDATPSYTGPGDDRLERIIVTSESEYREHFAAGRDSAHRGEVCPYYLSSERAARNIAELVPRCKLVAVLRNPVERAHSQYQHNVASGWEPLASFSSALDDENRRLAANWGPRWRVLELGFYARQLATYARYFPPEQLSVHLYDDLCNAPRETVDGILRFLGAPPLETSRSLDRRVNVSGRPRRKWLNRLLKRPNALRSYADLRDPPATRTHVARRLDRANLAPETLSAATRARLDAVYAAEIEDLARRLGRDLSAWGPQRATPATDPS